jgi:hypothetical protein
MSHPPSSDGASEFLPSHWRELEPLLEIELDAPAASRDRVLDVVSAGNATRHAALQQPLADGEPTASRTPHAP